MTRPTIITTDPGQDQAAAILAVLAAPEHFDVRAIVAVAGNIGLDLTVPNTLKLVDLAGRPDVPVHAGCPRPLVRELVTAEHVHGPTGLDGAELPDPTVRVQAEHGVDAIIRLLAAAEPGEYTILSLSPMTSLATALLQRPDVVAGIDRIVAMAGGYFEGGNITPAAEFNSYVDPQAVDVVLTAGAPLTILPLDVTHRMRSTPARLDAFEATGTRAGAAIAGMLRFSEAFDLAKYGWEGAPLHGPCVPLAVLEPTMFAGREVSVRVETEDELALGAFSVDWWSVTDEAPNALYLTEGDDERFYGLLTELYGRLP
jgi:purine nucleosidase